MERKKSSGSGSRKRINGSGSSFAFHLFKKASEGRENVFLSPLSIRIGLSMLAGGADGNSRRELIQALHLHDYADQDEIDRAFKETTEGLSAIQNITITIANKIYVAEKFDVKAEFKSNLEANYKSEAASVNFASGGAESQINEWVAQRTNHLIKDLFAPNSFDHLTRLALVNAVYFKGLWAEKFDATKTKTLPFYLTDGKAKQVQMMQIDGHFQYFGSKPLDCKILGLPYLGDQVYLYAILPNKKNGIEELKEKLTDDAFTKIRKAMRGMEVFGKFPTFKMRFRSFLIPVLKEMGVEDVFDAGKADLSGMSEDEGLFVSSVIHEAFVSVDEAGTDAAAATADIPQAKCMPIYQSFIADHPFVFLIYDASTNVVLFMGSVDNPEN